MHWRVKGVVQGVLSRVPGGQAINDRLQTTLGTMRDFEAHVDHKVVADWLVLGAQMQKIGVKPIRLDYLEIGTGWLPTLPLCFSLAGHNSCRSFDIAYRIKDN